MKQKAINKLRESGLKSTPQRISIMEYMEGNTTHPSAEDVYKAIRVNHPSLSFATVYNIIEKLK